jgi:hypothetical protein
MIKNMTPTVKPLRKNESYNPEAAKREMLKLMRTGNWTVEQFRAIATKHNVRTY